MADIQKELNQIKNAVYGKDVRGSIHDGIDKINKESEDSKEKANEAHDVMESIMNEGFDNAALEANFEQKLDDKIANLQPEWTQFKEDTETQLADTERQRRSESLISRKETGLYAGWVDDDGYAEVYTRMLPLMEDYNIPMTSALITSRIGTSATYLTESQIKELHDKGMEFLSHTHWHDNNHRPVDMTESELDDDFKTAQQIMKSLGLNHRGLVLPFANNSPLIQKVARRYFDYVIGTGTGTTGRPQYLDTFDNYYIRRVSVEYGFDFVKEQLDAGAARGEAAVIFVSHISQGNWYSDAYCRQIIEYALTLGYQFKTTQEIVDKFGNLAQFGNTSINAKGEVISDDLGVVINRHHAEFEVNGHTPLSEFKRNAITRCKIRLSPIQQQGMPINSSGFLDTYRLDEDLWAYQEFLTTRYKVMYTRSWDNSNNKWREWERESPIVELPNNKVSINDRYDVNYLYRRNTSCDITSGNESNFPENRTGTLYTYANTVYRYQEYQIYDSPKVYKRFWRNNTEEWSIWYKTQDIVAAHYIPSPSHNGSQKAANYDVGLTIEYIRNANSDFPFDFGNLITINEEGNGRGFQIAREAHSSVLIYRHEKSDGEWAKFRRIVTEPIDGL